MKVRDIEARRAAIPEPRDYTDLRVAALYQDVLDAIANMDYPLPSRMAKAALGRQSGRGEGRVAPERQRCELCGKPVPTPAHRFCGAACCARWEAGERP